ncbi:MAG TPA: bifunctional enoyl-CoA hydratase/phosphate acetyltransferase [Planctomycetota bacterium]|nr:bifunctional enoyl-CoA hydratase/phosphate acetyltransferase [Planctomycetota bacterium]HRR79750.1 bifunctional enoyl-CoA hydratase/phosphate acetyltransferase [Planctomycetota bacterium]HRT96305.1 bifunctional enoyl-CoA hydratase/phosphate acetyltransferase [Planctomycetota bacterium]
MRSFAEVMEAVREYPVKDLAVAAAEDHTVLEAVAEAMRMKMVRAILVGNEMAIHKTAEEHGINLGEAKIIHERDPIRAAATATAMVSAHEADILMKGYIHTDDFLRAVLDKERGLRAHSVMSHVYIIEHPRREQFLFLSDGAMNIAPDLERKADIILNAVHTAHAFGIEEPKVAVLAAIELVNPAMQATVDAATLHIMAERRQFSPKCVIDGPFGFDNAIDERAAQHKKIGGPVAGKADVLIVPDIEAGNILAKSLVYLGGLTVAGVIVGAKAPIVLTSRADLAPAKLASIACAVYMAGVIRELRLKVGKVHY